ncbi:MULTISPECIES: carbonic anhydrase [Clostridium]|uniref:carbonic anhydrase n=1 Tax=Clostridium TaxID=1485 RepID=UPI000825CB24|nr:MULTISPECIES: carbonic anhydrase [Clostridium]PJI09577.1 carbonic anhydrase [Clostridium sp. CT7]
MNEEFMKIERTLMEGNKRFILNKLKTKDFSYENRKKLSDNGQKPYAVVISCSDSRTPPETIFDVGIGEIFTIRNAGNIVYDNVIENVEFAVSHLNTRYIMVMGHEKCGAVEAALDEMKLHGRLNGFIQPLKEAVDNTNLYGKECPLDVLSSKVEDENIALSAKKLLKSEMLKKLYNENKIRIVKTKYFLTSGEVKILK